ncbi:MAG: NADH-quinone oxidoreductase subunit K [Anaerolineae bacterium]|nr:NADH-quinone oxidoreductase subunit K [Anaerolineae bacterium]
MTGNILLIGVLGLLGVGLYGLLIVRNLIKLVIALQILAKATALALVVAGQMSGQMNLGQSLALTVIVADTIVAVVGLALAVQVRQHFGTLDIKQLSRLKR